MTPLLIGLRSAVVLLYFAMLLTYAYGRLPDKRGDRIGAYGWIVIALGVVAFSSPTHMARLLGYSLPPLFHFTEQVCSLLSLLVGSILWAAARGYRRGGTRRSVRIGLCINLTVIAACIAAAYALP